MILFKFFKYSVLDEGHIDVGKLFRHFFIIDEVVVGLGIHQRTQKLTLILFQAIDHQGIVLVDQLQRGLAQNAADCHQVIF